MSKGKYFEEFEPGGSFETAARTITEADIVNFAGVSGDFNPLHTDEEHARTTPFGRRIAHGMLVLSAGTGLANQLGYFEGTTVAFLELGAKFLAPVFPGDTVRLLFEVAERKESSKLDRGVVRFQVSFLNQKKEKVAESQWTLLMRRRAAAGAR